MLSFPLCESLFKSSWIPPRRLASLLRMWCTFDIRLLERDRYYQRKANAHKARLKKIQNRRPGTGTIDNLPPRSLADNKKNDAKKKMMQVEKHWKIDRANKQLLNRMLSIENRKTSQYAPASGRTFSLNVSSRKKEVERINKENQRIVHRLQTCKPKYDRREWEKDEKRRARFLRNLSAYGPASGHQGSPRGKGSPPRGFSPRRKRVQRPKPRPPTGKANRRKLRSARRPKRSGRTLKSSSASLGRPGTAPSSITTPPGQRAEGGLLEAVERLMRSLVQREAGRLGNRVQLQRGRFVDGAYAIVRVAWVDPRSAFEITVFVPSTGETWRAQVDEERAKDMFRTRAFEKMRSVKRGGAFFKHIERAQYARSILEAATLAKKPGNTTRRDSLSCAGAPKRKRKVPCVIQLASLNGEPAITDLQQITRVPYVRRYLPRDIAGDEDVLVTIAWNFEDTQIILSKHGKVVQKLCGGVSDSIRAFMQEQEADQIAARIRKSADGTYYLLEEDDAREEN